LKLPGKIKTGRRNSLYSPRFWGILPFLNFSESAQVYGKLTVRDLDVRGKRVFMRVDYNVPLEKKMAKWSLPMPHASSRR